jgi:catechol 2,3-dioxygenase-like lactoylglutathione lyase family enzyme
MLSHLSLGVTDLERAIRFYDAALGALGRVRVWTHDNAAGYGDPGGEDRLALFLKPETHPAGPGFHLAFEARSAPEVDRFWEAACACGGTDEGAPGLRPHYGPGYYAAFVRDPDGHKLEAVHHGP